MPGRSSFDPPPIPLARPSHQVLVFRWTTDGEFELLPNIRCKSVKLGVGLNVGAADFRYVLDRGGRVDVNAEWPTQPEELLGNNASGEYLVEVDDRVVVAAYGDDAFPWVMFDGFVTLPSLAVTTDAQDVSFQAQATPIREWDDPLWPSMYRNADDPTNADANREVHLPARFNPDGLKNCTKDGDEADVDGLTYPIFLDEVACKARSLGQPWTLSGAVKYVVGRGNPDGLYVDVPDFSDLDDTLDSRTPKKGSTWYDPDDPSTFDASPIVVRDLDVTGLPWPQALERLLTNHGFKFHFALDQFNSTTSEAAEPVWKLKVYRPDDNDPATQKQLKLQRYGEALDPAKTNAFKIALTRASGEIFNEHLVQTDLAEYEVTLVLSALYTPASADAADATAMKPFQSADGAAVVSAANVKKYREYGADEDGSGHWDFGSSSWVTTPADLSDILGGADADPKLYVKRRRPGKGPLFTKDTTGDRRKPTLEISTDYAGKKPGIWDGTGTWYAVEGGWELLKDRFGIRITADNPEAWSTGNKSINFGVNAKSSNGVVRGISAQAKAGETRFHLKLTAVIQGDRVAECVAERRDASPTGYTIRRVIDARERYKFRVIRQKTTFNSGSDPVVDRDDISDALHEAYARRAANEFPPLSGPVLIPRLVNGYRIGDRITEIAGRDLSLQTNRGSESGEGPRYPMVVGVEYQLEGGQRTILHLSDERGEGRY